MRPSTDSLTGRRIRSRDAYTSRRGKSGTSRLSSRIPVSWLKGDLREPRGGPDWPGLPARLADGERVEVPLAPDWLALPQAAMPQAAIVGLAVEDASGRAYKSAPALPVVLETPKTR